ncbi:hypothetical protein GF324_04035 [bacterium]|nr:hypothetical protein [bacterium]
MRSNDHTYRSRWIAVLLVLGSSVVFHTGCEDDGTSPRQDSPTAYRHSFYPMDVGTVWRYFTYDPLHGADTLFYDYTIIDRTSRENGDSVTVRIAGESMEYRMAVFWDRNNLKIKNENASSFPVTYLSLPVERHKTWTAFDEVSDEGRWYSDARIIHDDTLVFLPSGGFHSVLVRYIDYYIDNQGSDIIPPDTTYTAFSDSVGILFWENSVGRRQDLYSITSP